MTPQNSRLFLKLCGFVQPADVAAASALDVDALGFVLADDARVPLDLAALPELFSASAPHVSRVAVVGPKTADECRRILELGFHAVQVVYTDWFTPELDGKAVIPVLFDAPSAEERMLALGSPGIAGPQLGPHGRGLRCLDGPGGGGRGRSADFTRARRLARAFPLLLAGGLRADNVAAAIATVSPRGVDVSSGIESEPGRKDPAKMAAFVAAVRAAERELC